MDALTLADLKPQQKALDLLLDGLSQNYLTSLGLINCGVKDRHLPSLLNAVSCVQELKLNWCEFRHSSYALLAGYLGENRKLRSVDLSWNFVLKEPYKDELTSSDADLILAICSFVRYNTNLEYLGLENMRLNRTAILKIVRCLKFALSCRVVQLSGNPGVTESIITKLASILSAKMKPAPINVSDKL